MAAINGEFYTGLRLNFAQTLRNWALASSRQLRDSYRTQRVWDKSRGNSVWVKSGRKRYLDANGRWKEVMNWSWYDESKLREKKDKGLAKNDIAGNLRIQASRGKYWYSTGLSYDIATKNPVTVVDGSPNPIIDFATTMGALYSEAGVGLTGPFHTRGSRSSGGRKRIKVNRAAPWHYDRRYASTWKPMAGDTHRPNTRQQVSLYARRLRWAARTIYEHDLTLYIGYMIDKTVGTIGNITWLADANGLPHMVVDDSKNKSATAGMTFEQYLERNKN